jgi:PAS domain S-box-containing protein
MAGIHAVGVTGKHGSAQCSDDMSDRDSTRIDEQLRGVHEAHAELDATLARDVRTPLTLLLGPLTDILASPASALVPGSRAALETARRSALRLLQLLDALRDHRSPAMAAPVDDSGFDLGSVTADIAGYFRNACVAAGLRLVVDCPPLAAGAALDRSAWEAIVVNLLANAVKTTAEGSITVRLRETNGDAQLTVTDTGAGIDARDLQYVFARVTPAADGSAAAGVGLPFVADLVRQHGGSIEVHSTGSRGTTFTARVPLEGAAAGRVAPRSSAIADAAMLPPSSPIASTEVSQRGYVVIAEDQDETRAYLCHVLERAGFSVDALADGRAALSTCQLRAPDVLVSDVLMPGLNGFELIERLRGDERTSVIPVLLLSAHGGEESRIEGIAAGADDYLVKPLSSRELVARVDGAVRLGRLRRETARREQADLDALFSLAPDGLLVVGPTGQILSANEQARKLFRYTAEEFRGLHVEALMPVDHRARHVTLRQAYQGAPIVRLMNPMQELRCVRADATEFTAEIALGPLEFKHQSCTIAIVRDITERKKLEVERAEAERRFRLLSSRLLDVQEAERRQLSAELHDRTSPQLAAIQINLTMLANLLGAQETEDIKAVLDDTVHLVDDTTIGIREISANLRPAVLDDAGLLPAVTAYAQQFTQRTGIVVQLHTDGATAPLSAAAQSSLFRIVQEALTNCVKHAKATHVTIELTTGGAHQVSLTVADDGVGFAAELLSSRGLGLLTMRERAEFMGGRFALTSTPGQGTRITVVV